MNAALQMVLDKVRGGSRFFPLAMLAAWLLCLLGWGAVMVLPNKYEASTRVFVDTRTALSPVIQGLAIQEDMNAYLNLARESLVGEARLAKVLAKVDPDVANGAPDDRTRGVEALRRNVEIALIPPPGNPTQPPAGLVYHISYRDSDRERSLQVVRILLDSFIEETLGVKRQSSETAEQFLTTQIAENENRLRESEERLAEFKRRNLGLMPGVEGDYFTRLQTELDAVRKARTELSVAVSRREEIAKQRRGEIPFTFDAAGTPGATAAPAGGGATTQAMISEAEKRLAALLIKYTDIHPEVIGTREEIAALERRRQEEIEALRRGDPEAIRGSGAVANPVYQSIQLALNAADVHIAELRGAVGQHEQKIAELRAVINSVPEVEAEFARLNRDYEVTRVQYAALVERLKKAQLGQDAEATSTVRFEIIDPPAAGLRPVAPDRPRFVVAIFLASLALAVALVLLMNALRPVFNSSRELMAKTDLPLLGEVTHIDLDSHRAAARRSYWRLAGGVVGLVGVFAGVLVFTFKHQFG
jgi:polysaccharide chain length determinant protein (PEP-CTERM system associated)